MIRKAMLAITMTIFIIKRKRLLIQKIKYVILGIRFKHVIKRIRRTHIFTLSIRSKQQSREPDYKKSRLFAIPSWDQEFKTSEVELNCKEEDQVLKMKVCWDSKK